MKNIVKVLTMSVLGICFFIISSNNKVDAETELNAVVTNEVVGNNGDILVLDTEDQELIERIIETYEQELEFSNPYSRVWQTLRGHSHGYYGPYAQSLRSTVNVYDSSGRYKGWIKYYYCAESRPCNSLQTNAVSY